MIVFDVISPELAYLSTIMSSFLSCPWSVMTYYLLLMFLITDASSFWCPQTEMMSNLWCRWSMMKLHQWCLWWRHLTFDVLDPCAVEFCLWCFWSVEVCYPWWFWSEMESSFDITGHMAVYDGIQFLFLFFNGKLPNNLGHNFCFCAQHHKGLFGKYKWTWGAATFGQPIRILQKLVAS